MRSRVRVAIESEDLAKDDFSPVEGFTPIEERPVPGLASVAAGLVYTQPFAQSIYQLDGVKESGIAAVLEPDGTLREVGPRAPLPRPARFWDDEFRCWRVGSVVWDGCPDPVQVTPDGLRRGYDASLMGEWPMNPPRPERPVNPEKARLVGSEGASS
jgi:hypothetical protein